MCYSVELRRKKRFFVEYAEAIEAATRGEVKAREDSPQPGRGSRRKSAVPSSGWPVCRVCTCAGQF